MYKSSLSMRIKNEVACAGDVAVLGEACGSLLWGPKEHAGPSSKVIRGVLGKQAGHQETSLPETEKGLGLRSNGSIELCLHHRGPNTRTIALDWTGLLSAADSVAYCWLRVSKLYN